MTETKHTPAPWRVSAVFGKLEVFAFSDGQVIARLGKKQKANAKLIAAAPLMYRELEALVTLFREYEAHHLQKSDNFKAERNRLCAEKIERVLAKARGEI